jgi:cell division septation protein DedD
MKFTRFSLLAAALVAGGAVAAAPSQKSVRDGIAAWQRSDYASAVAIWRPLAEKGDADAAFNLGQAYRLGRGVTLDLAKAKTWLEKAARSGHLDAQTTLGLLLFDSGNRDTAMQWLKKAAERGEPRAMLVYGTALFNGDGAPRDPLMAYAYVSRAAAQGLQPAKSTLEQMDQILPVDVRRKAVQIALDKAADNPAPGAKPTKVASKPPAKSPSKAAAPAAETPPAAAAASGSWRIQLGAFSQRSSAEALYRKLAGTAPVAGHAAIYIPVGSITRLQVGGYASKAAAAAACATLSAKGQPCFPVSAK